MIDIDLVRKNPSIVRTSELNRFRDPVIVDTVISLDENWRKSRFVVDQLNKRLNFLQRFIAQKQKDLKESKISDSGLKTTTSKKEHSLEDLSLSKGRVLSKETTKKDHCLELVENINRAAISRSDDSKCQNVQLESLNKNFNRCSPAHIEVGVDQDRSENKKITECSVQSQDENTLKADKIDSDLKRKSQSNAFDNKEILTVDSNQKNVNLSGVSLDLNHSLDPALLAEMSLEQLIEIRSSTKAKRDDLSQKLSELEKQLNFNLSKIGNVLHHTVTISNDEDQNPVLSTFNSSFKANTFLKSHEVCAKLGAEYRRGQRIAGHRAYFLHSDIALLGVSLARYAIDFLSARGFVLIQPPLFMHRDAMARTAQLSDFDDQLYALQDSFLIATSEQPLTAFFMDETISKTVRLCGHSQCFRKEAGAHGKDTTGIFRVHQFEKVEQFVVCGDDSDQIFDELLSNCCAFYESLDLTYRTVSIVSGALNDAAAVKVDLEAYFPAEKRFRELVSCSNCTDYQARALNVKFKNKYAHMLNCTMVAVQRAMCCIVETYQEKDGVRVPKVLIPYMQKDFMPYTKRF